MFWGLVILHNKKYTQVVEKSFRVTQASLDLNIGKDNRVEVFVCNDEKSFLLCTLDRHDTWQVPLDLLFSQGDTISFSSRGDGIVHLTGYVENDYNRDSSCDESDEYLNASEEESNDTKTTKQAKNNQKLVNDDNDSGDSDDSEYANGTNVTKDDDNESDDENDKDDSDDDEDDDDDDENEVDESDSEEEVVPVVKRPKTDVNKKLKENGMTKKDKKQMNQQDQKEANKNSNQSSKKILPGGLQVIDLRVGTGELVKKGKNVTVYYEGRLNPGNKIFDSAQREPGFTFKLGKGDVIKGWDLGVVGMHVGGKRRLIVPPSLAYGAKGSKPVIPPNATLTFDIEVRRVG